MFFFVYISVHRTSNIWFGNGRSILRRGGGINCRRRPCNREDYGIWFTISSILNPYRFICQIRHAFTSYKWKIDTFLLGLSRIKGGGGGLENTNSNYIENFTPGARKWKIGMESNNLSFKQAILNIYPRLRYTSFTVQLDINSSTTSLRVELELIVQLLLLELN